MKKINIEPGAASVLIELKDSAVYVYHGTDKTLLFHAEVKNGYWVQLWEKGIKNNKIKEA